MFTLFRNAENSQHHPAFRDIQGTIRKDIHHGKKRDMCKLSMALQGTGDPIGWVDAKAGTRHYIYQGATSLVHELIFDGEKRHTNLSL